MNTDEQRYCGCIEEINSRLALLERVGSKSVTTGQPLFDAELAYLQFRKILELIAFSSLVANKDKYSAAHANFANHWKAKDKLACIEKLNPHFYPVPLEPPQAQPDGTKLFKPVPEGFLNVGEFVMLYDVASEFVHTQNPFTTKDPSLNTVYAGKDWISRIRRLIDLHLIHLVDGRKWIVEAYPNKPVRVFTAEHYSRGEV